MKDTSLLSPMGLYKNEAQTTDIQCVFLVLTSKWFSFLVQHKVHRPFWGSGRLEMNPSAKVKQNKDMSVLK